MKQAGAIILGLLLVSSSVFADSDRHEGMHGRESADRPAQGGAFIERHPPGISPFPPHRDFLDHAPPREHEGRDRDRFPHRRAFIGVPIIVMPGYYTPQPPAPIEQSPQLFEQDGNYYWYYCPDIGYYPTVQLCPSDWLKVVPTGP